MKKRVFFKEYLKYIIELDYTEIGIIKNKH
jgi:hypothetical protein